MDFVNLDTMAEDGSKRDPKTLDYVSIAEWNVANIRIMYSLLECKDLAHWNDATGQRGTLDAYMVYTLKIMEYASQFPWRSVLKNNFGILQAWGLFTWEDDNQHLVTVHQQKFNWQKG